MDVQTQFQHACSNGDLHQATQLLQLSQQFAITDSDLCECNDYAALNISVNNDMSFRSACANGHLHVAQWLLDTKPDINIC